MTRSRRLVRDVLFGAVLLIASSGHVLAQDQSAPAPRVELGLNWVVLGGLMDVSDKADLQPGVTGPGLGVRVNFSKRVGLEVGGMLGSVDGRSVGFYDATVVVRRSTLQVGRWSSFLRLGAAGNYESFTVPEYRRTNDDRSITVYPGYQWRKLTWPNTGIVGMGIQRMLSTRAGLAVDGAFVGGKIGFGLRATTGLVVSVGSSGSR